MKECVALEKKGSVTLGQTHESTGSTNSNKMTTRPALWTAVFQAAVRSNHPEPEKMADTAIRARARSLSMMAARPKIMVIKEAPKPNETCVAEKKGRVVPQTNRCKAQTLEGRQCGFKASCGVFCKKHAPV